MAFLCLYVSVNHDSFCHFVDLCRIKGRGELPSKGKHISENFRPKLGFMRHFPKLNSPESGRETKSDFSMGFQ